MHELAVVCCKCSRVCGSILLRYRMGVLRGY